MTRELVRKYTTLTGLSDQIMMLSNTSKRSSKLFVLITSLRTRHRDFGSDWVNVNLETIDMWEGATRRGARVRGRQFNDGILMSWAFDLTVDDPDTIISLQRAID
ncbi:uncharacterized protein EAE97_001986 [Botrytis byssoidea]|uniref:Uncharacterized protein n=1 Tax=Botrytis byssoidea TaxID=139641 RepID=A0A9P5M820_9HELO|nr:uncharacterized protein EAE97_001986 [Botrytis byssoidea]KAF7952489.1 hypothetical protein EAE97_001986 [Botrytis byssoidea]